MKGYQKVTSTAADVARYTHFVTVPAVLRRLPPTPRAVDHPLTVITTGAPLSPHVVGEWSAVGCLVLDMYDSDRARDVAPARRNWERLPLLRRRGESRADGNGRTRGQARTGRVVGHMVGGGPPVLPPFDVEPTWVATGDLVERGSAGELVVLGRSDDVLVVQGNNVHPAEVEDVPTTCGEILEAAVMKDVDGRLVAYIVAGSAPPAVAASKRCADASWLPTSVRACS